MAEQAYAGHKRSALRSGSVSPALKPTDQNDVPIQVTFRTTARRKALLELLAIYWNGEHQDDQKSMANVINDLLDAQFPDEFKAFGMTLPLDPVGDLERADKKRKRK